MKIKMNILVFLALFSLSQITLAALPQKTYQVKIAPISEEIKLNAAGYHGTDVAVINYSNNTINVIYGNGAANFYLTTKTSGRITSEAVQYPYVQLTDVEGRNFFSDAVSNYATVSVYVSNGNYVVYVTTNP